MAQENSQIARFATTHWSVVLAARGRSSSESRRALAELCETYWYPLYAFVRRHGQSAADAQDLTQAFFVRLLEKGFLGAVSREKGKFRSFLLAAMKHFVANERDRARAQKRGGGLAFSLGAADFASAESRYRREPVLNVTA